MHTYVFIAAWPHALDESQSSCGPSITAFAARPSRTRNTSCSHHRPWRRTQNGSGYRSARSDGRSCTRRRYHSSTRASRGLDARNLAAHARSRLHRLCLWVRSSPLARSPTWRPLASLVAKEEAACTGMLLAAPTVQEAWPRCQVGLGRPVACLASGRRATRSTGPCTPSGPCQSAPWARRRWLSIV